MGGNKNWIDTTRAAIAENILNLTRLSKEQRRMESCIKNPVLWLALASHCVLHPEHAERLSSGQWSKPEDSKPVPPRVSIISQDGVNMTLSDNKTSELTFKSVWDSYKIKFKNDALKKVFYNFG